MRTQDEIVSRYKSVEADDLLGFRAEVLVGHMDYDHARPYLVEGSERDDWKPESLEPQALLDEIRSYLDFAWEKVANHRGISASRSVQKLIEMAWLAGHDEAVAAAEAADYPQYGAPVLKAIGDAFEVPMPAGAWATRMASGLYCRDDCMDGCGT